MTKKQKKQQKSSLMRIFISNNHKGLHLGNDATALQNMFTVNYPSSIRKTIFEQNHINIAHITHMLRSGELVIPIMDYSQAELLRAELAKDVFQNELDVRYSIEKNINADQAKQTRLELSKTHLNKADADFIDGVMQNGFWPLEIFGSTLGENVIIGIMDQAIHLWQEPFPGVNITKHNCDLKNCNIEQTLSLHDFCMHGTYIAGTILKFLPGLKNIHGFHSDISISKCDPNNVNGLISLGSIERTFLSIEKQLQQLERRGKQYAYILNISSYLPSNIDKNLNPINNTNSTANRETVINIYNIIRRLHRDYPRFQMVVSAGNDETITNDFYRLAPEVMAIGAHDLNFKRLSHSNAESDVITSTIGRGVDTVVQEDLQGTSFSSPIMTAMSAIIMSILPDLKNYELREIIRQLSVPDTEFLANDSPYENNKLNNPIFIFDLVRFCKILNKFYSQRIDGQLLKLLNEKAKLFYLEPLSKNPEVGYVIPNNEGNIQFNIHDKIGLTLTIDNTGNYHGSIDFCLSSVRIPPIGFMQLLMELGEYEYAWHDALLSSIKFIPLHQHKNTKIQMEFTRQADKRITGRYKKDNYNWSNFVMTMQGGGDIQNIMIGLKATPQVKIIDIEPIHSIEPMHSIKTHAKKPLLFSPKKNVTWLLPTNNSDDYAQENPQYLDIEKKLNFPTPLPRQTIIMSLCSGLVLLTLFCLRKKSRVNNGSDNSARTRPTSSNNFTL